MEQSLLCLQTENWLLTSQGKQEVLRTVKSQVCLQEGLCLQVGFGEILQRWWETETKKSQYFEQLIELIQFRVSQGSVENPVLFTNWHWPIVNLFV